MTKFQQSSDDKALRSSLRKKIQWVRIQYFNHSESFSTKMFKHTMNSIQCWAYEACIWSTEHLHWAQSRDDTENQRFNMSKTFISENAEISVVIDLKNSVKMSVKIVKTVKSVMFQIHNSIESLLSKQNCWTQQLHKAYIYKACQEDHIMKPEITKKEARCHVQL